MRAWSSSRAGAGGIFAATPAYAPGGTLRFVIPVGPVGERFRHVFYQRNTRRGKYAFASGLCNARMPDGKIVTHSHAILAWISRQS